MEPKHPTSRSRIFPSFPELLDSRAPFLAPLALALLGRVLFWLKLPAAFEDAYITFRYARNLAEGHGLVYNVGERVMGFSSPLWTLWCSLGVLAAHDPVIWARGTSLVCDLVTILVVGNMLRRHVSNTSAWMFNLFFALWPYFSVMSASGLEMNCALCLAALAAASTERKSRATGLLLGALTLIRPLGFIAAAVVSLGARWRDRWIALGILAAAVVAATLYYGSPIPQSVLAKSGLYGTPGPWAARFWWEWIIPFPLGRWPTVAEGNQFYFLTVLLAPAACIGARRLLPEWKFPPALLGAALLAIWATYAVTGVAYFPWYFMAPLVCVGLLASVGLPQLVRGRAIPAALLLYLVGSWTVVPFFYVARAQHESLSFESVADYLAENSRPGEKIMLEPIGLIGWKLPLIVVDEVGLVSPQVVRARLRGAGWYADLVGREHPEWLVVRRTELEGAAGFTGAGQPFRSRVERDSVLAGYDFVKEEGSEAGAQAMLVFRRRAAAGRVRGAAPAARRPDGNS